MARREVQPRLVDGRNRVALTRDVRRALDVGPGDYVTFRVVDGQVLLYRMELRVVPRRPPGAPTPTASPPRVPAPLSAG